MRIGTFGGFMAILCVVLSLSCACRGRSGKSNKDERQQPVVKQYTYVVKNTYPHETDAFTQGLFWHDGHLWESTGLEGYSRMRKVELTTGRAVASVDLDVNLFGEGAALLDGKIYQLTWQNGIALVYDPATLERTGQFRYTGDGWGLTTDGEWLYMSDGSSRITVLDPADFSRKRSISVKNGRANLRELNELEWIDGKIWANVYMTETIAIIDPATGAVEGIVDCTGILPAEDYTADTDYMNGIAHDPATGRIFVTGKNWPKLFEIELREK